MQSRINTKKILLAEIMQRLNANHDYNLFPLESNADEVSSSEQWIAKIYQDILFFRIKLDQQHHIQSTWLTLKNENKIWVRHADVASINTTVFEAHQISACNYIRIFYAYILAAIVISRIYQFDHHEFIKAINHVKIIISRELNTNELKNDEILCILSEGKGYLINVMSTFCPVLDKITLDSMLDQTKNWVALESPSVPVCTIIATGDKYANKRIMILDEPCSHLTPEQKELFAHLPDKSWFNELTDFEQCLVKYYSKKILSGTCVIPSPLRRIIPLLKNAYQQTLWIHSDASETDFELISSLYRSAAVAHLSHKNNDIATKMTCSMLSQQRYHCQADANVFICLNSLWGDSFLKPYEWWRGNEYVEDDSKSIELTEAAVSLLMDQHIYSAKLCLNGFRMIEFNNYNGIDKILNIVESNLTLLDPAQSQVVKLRLLIEKVKLLQSQFTLLDLQIKSLDIIHYFVQVAMLNNQLISTYPTIDLKSVDVWFGCASGENRTGITYYHHIALSVIEYFENLFNVQYDSNETKQIFDLIAKSQHIHIMTGYQGSIFGTEGIRSKSSGSFKSAHPMLQLVTQSADMKRLVTNDASFNLVINKLKSEIVKTTKEHELRNILPWIKKYIECNEKQRDSYLFLSDQEKKVYENVFNALFDCFKANYEVTLLLLLDTQKIMTELQASTQWMVELNEIVTKLIVNVRYLSSPSQLIKQSIFKAEDKVEPASSISPAATDNNIVLGRKSDSN